MIDVLTLTMISAMRYFELNEKIGVAYKRRISIEPTVVLADEDTVKHRNVCIECKILSYVPESFPDN